LAPSPSSVDTSGECTRSREITDAGDGVGVCTADTSSGRNKKTAPRRVRSVKP
jgi:hypothetical protein